MQAAPEAVRPALIARAPGSPAAPHAARREAAHPAELARFSPGEWRSALALCEALIPGRGDRLRCADEQSLARVQELLDHVFPHLTRAWGKSAQLFDALAVLRTGRRFRSLGHERQQELLRSWEADRALGPLLQAFAFPLKFAHFDRQEVYEALGGKLNVVQNLEAPRWLEQIVDASTLEADADVECEVVVIGTGAGGAVVGKELADRGYAVCFVEEGEHVRRDRFTGSSVAAHRDFYRGAVALGNAPFPVFIGRLVGGSTAVNGGTSFRTPPWVLDRWCEQTFSDDFSPVNMDARFTKVEHTLGVAPANAKFIGPIQDVFRRGCDALGWSHFTIIRNAPGCEGTGFCDFGCRTDARRSTNISYVPPALEKGAMLYTHVRAERVMLDGGRAVGIEGVSPKGRRVRVRGKAVIVAGGAVPTPLFLLKQGLCNASGELGKNLTLHPSGGVSAVMEEQIRGWENIPQGYGCSEHLRDGILLTAAQPDLNYAALMFPVTGDRLMDRMAAMPWTASFGVLIADAGSGRVVLDAAGTGVVRYDLLPADIERYRRGVIAQSEICFAAGARTVLPSLYGGYDKFDTRADLDRFRTAKLEAKHLPLTSYHPLGTAKMGRDPRTSVVDLDHQTHDVPGLFIVDGSTVSGPLGVNPQLTIMAVATRAAERIAELLG